MTARRTPHRFTVATYEKMIDLGILKEDDRVELIRGEIVAKMPIGDPHIACVDRLNRLLVRAVGDDAIVSIQNPIRLADSEPEPDVVLKRPRDDFYITGKPGPADILLLIEVADASLDDDREVKRPLYAEAGIGEYWIVNLVDGCLEVHRQPRPDGTYADVRTLRPGETIEIAALPRVTVAVANVLAQ
ncbi:MAG TPA: Uma2 family endonuclease [Gemmataceae bacterium]|nr:Uma2 family endonuclease [Gemmataceae bacterium]